LIPIIVIAVIIVIVLVYLMRKRSKGVDEPQDVAMSRTRYVSTL